MKRLLATAVALGFLTSAASAATIKIGVVGPFSGPFALQGKNFKAGIDAYLAANGMKVGNDTVEVVYRDLPSADPGKSAALSRELVVQEKVQYLAGYYFTPDALAAAQILQEANTPMVIFNAATSAILKASPFAVRTSFTTPQTSAPMASVAKQKGFDKVITVVSDYGPGVDSENAFKAAFTAAGGTIVESIRMPMTTNDFSPILQRAKNSGAQAIFAFLPSGPPTLGFVRAYNENGLKEAKIALLAPGDLTQESDLPALGASALGLLTTFHYAVSHDSPENKAFVAAASKAIGNPQELSFPAVGAYDGMHVIYKMIQATGGKQDASKAIAAVQGLSWTSPRGPVSIDASTRQLTQNIYLREVAKTADGSFMNKEIQTFPNQVDPASK